MSEKTLPSVIMSRRRPPNNNPDEEKEVNIEVDNIQKEEEERINEIIDLLGDELDFKNDDVESISNDEYRRQSTSVNQRYVFLAILALLTVFMIWVNYYNYKQLERIKEEYGPQKKVEPELWWQKALIYHVYVRSFKDSNGDGIGDINGLLQHLDHFIYLGVDAILLSDVFESPQVDLGRDVTNFTRIDPLFGTEAEFSQLLAELHDKGIKLLLEFVPNHTADKHPWFVESRRGGEGNKYKDYYVWADGRTSKNGTVGPPNNWLSMYGGSAWSWDETRRQFYYHKYHRSMPDLNHRSHSVQDEIVSILRFWLRRGVDGIFLNDVHVYFEADDVMLDEPRRHDKDLESWEYGSLDHPYTEDHDEVHDFLSNWKEAVDSVAAERKTRLPLLVETHTDSAPALAKFLLTGADSVTLSLLPRAAADTECGGFCLQELVEMVKMNLPDDREGIWMSGSPDTRRITHIKGRAFSAGLLLLQLLLPGGARTFQGEEVALPEVSQPYNATQDLKGRLAGEHKYSAYTRDYSRSPLPWLAAEHQRGFTRAERPWLPFPAELTDADTIGYQRAHPAQDTPLHLYAKLARLRKEHSFILGDMQYGPVTDELFSFMRFDKNSAPYLVVVNVGEVRATKDFTGAAGVQYGKLVAHAKPPGYRGQKRYREGALVDLGEVVLAPGEGLVLMLLLEVVPE